MSNALRVGFWTAHLSEPHSAGIGVYAREFVGSLVNKVSLTEFAAPGRSVSCGRVADVAAWRLHRLLCRWSLSGLVRRLALDVVHFPFLPRFVPAGSWRACKLVTVHGSAGAQLPERADDCALRRRTQFARRILLQHYDGVITSSVAAKREICAVYDLPPQFVQVVPCGVSESYFAIGGRSGQAATGAEPPYLLCVSQLRRKKNVARLVRAFGHLVQRGCEHRLLIVGESADAEAEVRAEIARLRVSDRVRLLGRVPFDRLLELYGGADLVVHPSLHEGFGLPVAEAMAAGRPVVCSDLPVLREIAGDAATYFEPRDERAIAAALDAVLSDSDRQVGMVARGKRHAARFTWEAASEQLVTVYRGASHAKRVGA